MAAMTIHQSAIIKKTPLPPTIKKAELTRPGAGQNTSPRDGFESFGALGSQANGSARALGFRNMCKQVMDALRVRVLYYYP
jgi:hypothetical protein